MNDVAAATRSTDVLVVGAGIVGAACAHAFAREGLTVAVVDPHPVGSGATAAGMGHVLVSDEPDAEFALTRRSRALWHELARELPQAAEYVVPGTLWVATDDEEIAVARAKATRLRAAGIAADVLDETALRAAEPALRAGLPGGLRVEGDAVVYPPVVAQWLLERAGVAGDRLVIGRFVRTIEPGRVVLDDGTTRCAGTIVNAAGIAAGALAPGLSLRARKGHLVITDRYPGVLRHEVVELGYVKNAHGNARESVACNVQPRASGQWLVGSSRQFDVADATVEPRMLARVVARAIEFLPQLARMNALRAWTGLRAVTPDGIPAIGAQPGCAGAWIAAGHEGLGITTSLATAELLVDLVVGRAPHIDPAPFDPARFAQRRAAHE